MAATFKLISKATLTSNASQISITSIPNTYDDLVIYGSFRIDSLSYGPSVIMRMNSDSGNNYTSNILMGTRSGSPYMTYTYLNSTNYLNIGHTGAGNWVSGTFGKVKINIPEYRSAQFKSINSTFNNTNMITNNYNDNYNLGIAGGAWRSTAAITSLSFSSVNGSNLVVGSSVKVYGISKT